MVNNFTLSITFLACLWLGNLIKTTPFFFFFFNLPVSLSYIFYQLADYCLFYKPRTHFQNLPCCVQPSTLARWVRLRWKRPSLFQCLWEQKRAWTSLSLEPVISVFGDWRSWYIVSVRGHFTSLLCRGGDGGPERERACPEWNGGCPSQDENRLGSWSLLLWIIVISEFIRD